MRVESRTMGLHSNYYKIVTHSGCCVENGLLSVTVGQEAVKVVSR